MEFVLVYVQGLCQKETAAEFDYEKCKEPRLKISLNYRLAIVN